MQTSNRSAKLLLLIPVILFFGVFLMTGLRIFDDYGPVSEERNQIDAGHIIWAYITGDNSHFPDLPDLEHYFNRYYGQGGTFITVLAEAFSGFSWDVNRVWKVRRLWNFLCFFFADFSLFWLIRKRSGRILPAFLGALNLVLLPRMFPEIFYNDRDPLFLSWLIFSFCAMMLFLRKTNFLTAVLFGCVIAFTVSVRMFGLIFVIPLVLIFIRYPSKRRLLFPVLIVFFLVWYGLSPIAWKDPFKVIGTAIVHLTTKQRMLDTQGSTELLFAGKYCSEQDLPWFYLPLWMLISTPLALLGFAVYGGISRVRCRKDLSADGYGIIDLSLGSFFILFMVGIPLIRPTLYSGWRHFYFLNLSLVWFAVIGLERVLRSPDRIRKIILFSMEGLSLLLTLGWIISAHPYEMVYYNPAFRRTAPNNFERDMGYTSTLECLNFLTHDSPDQKIEVMNANAFIPFSLIGLPKPVRERFSTIDLKIQRSPMRYIIYNYNNAKGNTQQFPYYAPIYSIERNGTKLAEVFRRTNNSLLDPDGAVESIHASVNDDAAGLMLSDDKNEIWQGSDQHSPDESVTINLKEGIRLESIEVFPGDHTSPSEMLRFYISEDDQENWHALPAEKFGTNGWKFQPFSGHCLQIRSDDNSAAPWQIRQILFYGKTE